MTEAERLADFVARADYEAISERARRQLKIRVLDSFGCAIGALAAEPIRTVRAQLADFGGNPLCSLIGGGKTAPDRAAFYNGALVRYLDFMDSYLAKGETCHPATISHRCSPPQNMPTPAARCCWRHSRSPIRCMPG
jgi:2-methylcitrate dehydratase